VAFGQNKGVIGFLYSGTIHQPKVGGIHQLNAGKGGSDVQGRNSLGDFQDPLAKGKASGFCPTGVKGIHPRIC
jgi:hypothetical protein